MLCLAIHVSVKTTKNVQTAAVINYGRRQPTELKREAIKETKALGLAGLTVMSASRAVTVVKGLPTARSSDNVAA